MPQRPNLLLIHCHDLGRHLHCYGVPSVQTPHLDALAARGVRFAKSFCTAPQCSPSRAALFTGRYPHCTGVMGLCHANFAWDLHPGEKHLAQLLAEAGYATAGVGVIHETRSGPERIGLQRYDQNSLAEKAVQASLEMLETFRAQRDRSFYLQVGFSEPHRKPGSGEVEHMGFLGDHLLPDEERGVWVPGYLRDTPGTRAELAELQGALRHVDAQVGRILEALAGHGLAENTLLVFTTDHGIALPRAKCSCYEPGLEVALILRLPSRAGWHGGRVVEELVSNVDNVPSWLEVLGLPVPENVQGRSFAPLLDGRDYAPREAVFGEQTYHGEYVPLRSVRTARHKLILNFAPGKAFFDPSQSWHPRAITVSPPDPARSYKPLMEVYDLAADPWEQQNVADDERHAEVQRELLARLGRHMRETDDPLLRGAVMPPLHRQALALLQVAAR